MSSTDAEATLLLLPTAFVLVVWSMAWLKPMSLPKWNGLTAYIIILLLTNALTFVVTRDMVRIITRKIEYKRGYNKGFIEGGYYWGEQYRVDEQTEVTG